MSFWWSGVWMWTINNITEWQSRNRQLRLQIDEELLKWYQDLRIWKNWKNLWKKRDEREAKKCRKNLEAVFQEPGPSTLKKFKTSMTPKKLTKGPMDDQAISSKTSRNRKKPSNSNQGKIFNTTMQKGRGWPRKKQQESSDSESDSSSYSVASSGSSLPDAECQFCSRLFSEDTGGKEWLLCSKWFQCYHAECDGTAEKCGNKRKFICTTCFSS